MYKWLRIIIMGLSILAAFTIGINVGICLAEKCGQAAAEEVGMYEADELGAYEADKDQAGCRIEIWENGADAGKVVITTRIENISELPGGILVVRK